MIIRPATIEDTSAIVQLLKESLGESLLQKTESIWRYKHEQNPFGNSHVLLAEENNQLIGVRAFMQWEWRCGDKKWQSYRAVDTATHPMHQGRGIFKKLTLQALEEVGASKYCFIFNTPNEKSRPGYLKMGWQALGKINILLVPTFLYSLKYIFSKTSVCDKSMDVSQLELLCVQHNDFLKAQNTLFTPKSAAYLSWRYSVNPLQSYRVVTGKDWYVAMYVKRHNYFNELRLAEVISSKNKDAKKEIRRIVTKFALKNRCFFITTTDKTLFPIGYFGAVGPVLTCRDLSRDLDILKQSKKENAWQYAMGDLELF